MFEIFQQQFSFWSCLDIAIVAFVIYRLLILIRGTRAAQMLTGILILAAAFLISAAMPFYTLHWIMDKFYASFIIILIIIFQDDIRHILGKMGKKSIISNVEPQSSDQIIDELSRAAFALASKHYGALIVIERSIILSRYVELSTLLDARVSQELFVSIFNPSSPIHDGAVIIQSARASAAGCFLPLSRQENLDPTFGTRHRAALGISIETDAIVILVSEEGGYVSLIKDGTMQKMQNVATLRLELKKCLIENETAESIQDNPISENASDL